MDRKLIWIFFLALHVFVACQGPSGATTAENPDRPLARNVVLMIGDGMGLTHISAAMLSSKEPLAMLQFPVTGFHRSSCYNDLITDSAASATAMACGIKTIKFGVGINKDSIPCKTILEEAEERGLSTGIVVTSTLVHATPAAFAAHQVLRAFYEPIATDMLKTDIDFMVGGGRQYFERRKSDGRDLVRELKGKGYVVSDIREEPLEGIIVDPTMKFIFFTNDGDPPSVLAGRNYLPYASELGMNFLRSQGRNGFFLLIEGSQIDWAGHSNDEKGLIAEMLDFDRAVGRVLRYAQRRGDTLVIVTTDHETGGLAITEDSKFGDIHLKFTTNEHTPSLSPVFAFGPGSELFSGVYENSDIYHKMRQALGWEPLTVGK